MTHLFDRDHLIGEILEMNARGAKAAGESHGAANPINALRELDKEDDVEIFKIHQLLTRVVGRKA